VDVGERDRLDAKAQLDPGGMRQKLGQGQDDLPTANVPAPLPRTSRSALRSTAAGGRMVSPALAPTWTRRTLGARPGARSCWSSAWMKASVGRPQR
jgi:hypothetical protein